MKQLDYATVIAKELNITPQQVNAVAKLLEEGATIPFIARYRKEATGTLDEVAIQQIRDRLEQLAELDKRREAICTSLQERNLLTPELQKQIDALSDKPCIRTIDQHSAAIRLRRLQEACDGGRFVGDHAGVMRLR